MSILIICIVAIIALQIYVLKVKWGIYATWLDVNKLHSAERLYKAVLGFSPNRLLYLSDEDEITKYELLMDAMCAHLGTETYYQEGLPNFKITLRWILWKMKIRHVINWKTYPKRSVVATLLFCLPLMVSAQNINLSAYVGGTVISQEDPNIYDLETGAIAGVSGTVAWETLYIQASALRESHDFNVIPSFKGHGIELSAGWTTKEDRWQAFVGPYYRSAWDTGNRMHNYGVQVEAQYGIFYTKGQLGFYNYQQYTGYSGVAAIGARFQL